MDIAGRFDLSWGLVEGGYGSAVAEVVEGVVVGFLNAKAAEGQAGVSGSEALEELPKDDAEIFGAGDAVRKGGVLVEVGEVKAAAQITPKEAV